VVNELDYEVQDTTTAADILDTEIIGYEVVDRKSSPQQRTIVFQITPHAHFEQNPI